MRRKPVTVTVPDLKPAAMARGEKLGELANKESVLVKSAQAFSENATTFRDAERVKYEQSKWNLFACCSGRAVLGQVAEARPAEPVRAAASSGIDVRAAAAFPPARPRTPTVELTKGEVDEICSRMGAMITEYDPGRNTARQEQLTTFGDILSAYAEKTKSFRDPVQLPKSIYDELRNELRDLLTAVSKDHAQNGGLALGALKVGNKKSSLQQKLEACLDLLPEDGKAPSAALAARR